MQEDEVSSEDAVAEVRELVRELDEPASEAQLEQESQQGSQPAREGAGLSR
jgi:hypothetical protein